MDIRLYADMRERYPLPDQMESAGNVVDPLTGHMLAVGIRTHRKLYAETGYICDPKAPEELHACVCSMLGQIQGEAIIKTVLLTPETIYGPICKGARPTKEMVHYSEMALRALLEAFKGYLNDDKEDSHAV